MEQPKSKFRIFIAGYYHLLLLWLLALFIFRPFTHQVFYVGGWKLCLSLVILSSIFNIHHTPTVKTIASCLAVPAVILSWLDLAYPGPLFFISNAFVTALFLFICTISILYDVVLRAKVTLETLRGVICAYFMIAFAFAYSYYLVEYIFPNSFHLAGPPASIYDYAHYFSQFLYFSFGTLLAIGYGDITALKSVAQTLAILEGIIGQFYIAILVARIVSVYSFYAHKERAEITSEPLQPRHQRQS
jgi:voltage-gated potassium channel